MTDKQTTYEITPTSTVGIYGQDAEGNPWTTFGAINHTETCAECGKEIDRGWSRGKMGEEVYFCSKHISYKERS